MKRMRMPAISATIGPIAMPINMALFLSFGSVLDVAPGFFDRLAGLVHGAVDRAPGFLRGAARAFAIARAKERCDQDRDKRFHGRGRGLLGRNGREEFTRCSSA